MPDIQVSPQRQPQGPNRRSRRNERFGRAYVGIAEAATYLDVEHKTVRRLITQGRLPAYRLGKRLIKVKVTDLDALLTPMRGGAA
jgi:excisionase family DNA binding protein